jgi:hypothetical protein
VATNNATNVEETTATLNGTLTNDGGQACDARFNYGLTTGYGTDTAWQTGKVTGNTFSQGVTTLAKGTLHHFRAEAKNSAGTSDGADKTFLTKPDAPTGFTATPKEDQVKLGWTKGAGANRTLIMRKQGGYPANRLDGTQVYFDTGTSFTDTGVTGGIAYYYAAWSEVTADSLQQYSDDAAQAKATPLCLSASVATATGTGIATFTTSKGCITSLMAVAESTFRKKGKPGGVAFPHGFFSFNISGIPKGSTITLTMNLPSPMRRGAQYWMYQNTMWTNLTQFLGSNNDGDAILTLTVTDGGPGDGDGSANGRITQVGGPGQYR